MPKNVGRVEQDIAGGVLMTPIVPNVFIEGKPIAVVGTVVTPHGRSPHDVVTMIQGSPNVYAGGKPVCGTGDLASCGHPLVSTSKVFVN